MGSIFAGLVQVGAWGCFDEFNRINVEVLSVVSAQLKAIQNSLITGKPTVDIGVGGEINIKTIAGFATCGVFITMNPGYAGRTELPDNLKALFRPVTMIVPDLLQICEIMLFSEGFETAKVTMDKRYTCPSCGRAQDIPECALPRLRRLTSALLAEILVAHWCRREPEVNVSH